MPDLPPGERKLVKDEHLFIGRPHRGRHRWAVMGDKVCCGVCGKLRRGETMPDWKEPVLR